MATLSGWDASALISKYVEKKSTADYYPRVQYTHTDNNISKGIKYTLSYRYKYMDRTSAMSGVPLNQLFIHISNSLTANPSGWELYPGITSESKNNRSEMYVVKSASPDENGWRWVSSNITLTGIESNYGNGDSLDFTKLSNVQAELKGFNNAGCIFDKAAKAAVEYNTANDGTIDVEGAVNTLKAELARHDYKIYVDDFKLKAETDSVPVTITAPNATVKVNGVEAENGDYRYVGKGYKTTVKIASEDGHTITGVSIDGEEQDVSPCTEFQFKKIFDSRAQLVVTTKKGYPVDVISDISAFGTVKIDETELTGNAVTRIVADEESTISITPHSGCDVVSVVINGNEQEIPSEGGEFKYIFTESSVDLSVKFRQAGVCENVLVFKRDFENGDTNGSNFTGIAQEASGNHYASKTDFVAETIVVTGKANSQDTSPHKIISEHFNYRFNFLNDKITYKNGKTYSLTWDSFISEKGEKYQMKRGASGFNATFGGWLATYFGGNLYATSQWYGQNATSASGTTIEDIASFNSGTGWTKQGYNGISFKLWDGVDPKTVGITPSYVTINGLFMQWETAGRRIAELLAQYKAYQGYGITGTERNKFTITDSDIYGDEQGLVENGGTYTRADLCKEWNLTMDCSPLKSAKRTEAFATALNETALEIGLDNIEMKAEAMVYNIPVKLSGGSTGSVKFVTNTYTGESTVISAAGTVKANDYYGITAVVTPASSDDFVKNVTYGGEIISVVKEVKKIAPSNSNIFDNNINVKIDSKGLYSTKNAVVTNNYVSNDLSIFKDAGNQNFSLTDAGGRLKLGYTFADSDGDSEGGSLISWWASSAADGDYERIYNAGDSEIIVSEAYNGKYIKAEITPVDSGMRVGKTVNTVPVLISGEPIAPDESDQSKTKAKRIGIVTNSYKYTSTSIGFDVLSDTGETLQLYSGALLKVVKYGVKDNKYCSVENNEFDFTILGHNDNACNYLSAITNPFAIYYDIAKGTAIITATTSDGGFIAQCTISVTKAYTPGDINGDGRINNRDATHLLRYLAGWGIELK